MPGSGLQLSRSGPRGPTLVLALPQTWKDQSVPDTGPQSRSPCIKEGPCSVPCQSLICPSSPEEMPVAGLLSGRGSACFTPGFWETANGARPTVNYSAPRRWAMP